MKAAAILYPCSFVIFGATGNLASNKLLPGLYHLDAAARLPENLNFIAVARRPWGSEEWQNHMLALLRQQLGKRFDQTAYTRFAARFHYLMAAALPPSIRA